MIMDVSDHCSLTAITDLSIEQHAQMTKLNMDLCVLMRTHRKEHLVTIESTHRSYASYTATGYLAPATTFQSAIGRDITALEVAMYVDSGFFWFGGAVDIYADRTFRVLIYTD